MMMMTYPTVTHENALELLKKYRNQELVDDVPDQYVDHQEGSAVDAQRLADTLSVLFDIVESCGDRRNRGDFDRHAAPEVHARLALEPVVAGDPGFWRWLTFSNGGEFAAIVDWRYSPKNGSKANDRYFGVAHVKESMYGYLWLRANAVFHGEAEDPYELARLGDVDLWQSHIVRVDFGSVPAVARAFIRFVSPETNPDAPNRSGYRSLARELSRRNATVLYEALDDVEAWNFVRAIWEDREEWMSRDV